LISGLRLIPPSHHAVVTLTSEIPLSKLPSSADFARPRSTETRKWAPATPPLRTHRLRRLVPLHRSILLGVCLALGLFAADAQARDKAAYGVQEVLRLSNNRPAVKVVINGQGPFLFLVDTATSNTVLTPGLRDKLGLPATAGPAIDVVTAAGSARSHYHLIAETAMAGVIVEGVRAVVLPLPASLGIDGALGADFLSNFTVDLNIPARTITLYPERTELVLPGFRRIHGRANAHGFIILPALVEGIVTSAVFDSGAAFTVGNPRLAIAATRYGIPTARVIESTITDAVRQKQFAEAFNFTRVEMGPISWWDARVLIANMRVFKQLGLDSKPAIFIGMDLMGGRRIVIDYTSASVWLAP
jgi:hypothetical protein